MKKSILTAVAVVAAFSLPALDGDLRKQVKLDSVTFKKSYIWLEEAPKPTRAGENLTLRIHYKLDPSDTWGDKPTQMMCMPLGL